MLSMSCSNMPCHDIHLSQWRAKSLRPCMYSVAAQSESSDAGANCLDALAAPFKQVCCNNAQHFVLQRTHATATTIWRLSPVAFHAQMLFPEINNLRVVYTFCGYDTTALLAESAQSMQ